MNEESTIVEFREYAHLQFTSPCPFSSHHVYVVLKLLFILEYRLIIFLVLAEILHDLLTVFHVIFLVASLSEKAEGTEQTISIWQDLLNIETFISESWSQLCDICCILPLLLLVMNLLIWLPLRSRQFILISFSIVLFGISLISTHFIIIKYIMEAQGINWQPSINDLQDLVTLFQMSMTGATAVQQDIYKVIILKLQFNFIQKLEECSKNESYSSYLALIMSMPSEVQSAVR